MLIVKFRLRFSSALQQNEIMNAFADDWQTLGEEMTGIGGPGDVHLKVKLIEKALFIGYY
jgi:hypothetical protein